MVTYPADYRWSSYRTNALGEGDPLILQHPLCEALGTDAGERRAAYCDLFHRELEPKQVDEIRRATNGSYALGNERFAQRVAAAQGRRATPVKPAANNGSFPWA